MAAIGIRARSKAQRSRGGGFTRHPAGLACRAVVKRGMRGFVGPIEHCRDLNYSRDNRRRSLIPDPRTPR